MKIIQFKLAAVCCIMLTTSITHAATLSSSPEANSAMSSAVASVLKLQGDGSGAIISAAPTPEGVTLKTRVVGRATNIGRYTRTETLFLNPLTGQFTGEAVFTARRGDQLRARVAGSFILPTTTTGTYTFNGGTGRFRTASGTAGFVVVSDDQVNFEVVFLGSILPNAQ